MLNAPKKFWPTLIDKLSNKKMCHQNIRRHIQVTSIEFFKLLCQTRPK